LSLFAPEHPGDARCLERFTEREYMFGHREFAPLLLWEARSILLQQNWLTTLPQENSQLLLISE